jgi:hypothetical protein
MVEPLLESLGMKETVVKASEVRRSGGWDLSWFLLLERGAGEGGRQAGTGLGDNTSRRMAQRWPSLMGKGQNSP